MFQTFKIIIIIICYSLFILRLIHIILWYVGIITRKLITIIHYINISYCTIVIKYILVI